MSDRIDREGRCAPPDPLAASGVDDLDLLDALLDAEGVVAPADGIPRRGAKIAPLSPAQRPLWFLHQLEPASTAYTIAGGLLLRGALHTDALERSFAELISRHEALRTGFEPAGGEPRQVVHDPAQFTLERARAASPAEALRLGSALARRPWDLTHPPLVRALLVEIGPREHALFVTMHHLAADGASLGVLFREIAGLYGAFCSGARSPLPPLPIQYGDFALWQSERLAGSIERALSWWKERLARAPERLELPYDRLAAPIPSDRGAAHRFSVPRVRMDVIDALARSEKASRFMVVVAAFAAFLARITGQRDILLGTPVGGRDRSETEGLIGFFVNTIVLRADLTGDPPFRTVLGRVREMALGAYARADVPFDRLVEAVRPARAGGRTPLFQVMVDEDEVTLQDLVLSGLDVTPLALPSETAQFDLSFTFGAADDGSLRAVLEYATDLFDAETIQSLASSFETFLAEALTDPSRPISLLPLLSPERRSAALRAGNARPAPAPPEYIHHLFERQAARRPDAIAVWHGSASLTYGILDRRANALARRLREAGAGPEVHVGVVVEKSIDLIVALLAVLKAGAAYVPIDPSLPAPRRRFLADDSGARIILTRDRAVGADSHRGTRGGGAGGRQPGPEAATGASSEALGAHHEYGAGVLVLRDEEWAGFTGNGPDGDSLPDIALPGSLAYVLYTSGTTGTPKGVGVTHASLAGAFHAWSRLYELGAITLQGASPGFDVFTGDLVRALGSGGALVLVDRDTLLDPSALAALIRERRIEFADFVPGVLRPLAEHLLRTGERLESIRILVVGSDSWTMADHALFRRIVKPDAVVLNAYGVTEGTIDSSAGTIVAGDEGRPAPPVGAPLANTAMHVLDEHLEPLPDGVAGEVWLGGPAVARGYHGRPDLTAERFVPDPHGEPGARLYRTGDRARRLPDGRIEFLGRSDDQVKIRGVRVEPAEIEAALLTHPGARAAVAIPAPDRQDGVRIVAFYVGDGSESALREHLRARLPAVMVPARLIRLDVLPLGVTGKIDRLALAALAASAVEDESHPIEAPVGFVPPKGPVEEIVTGIWSRLLGAVRVGATDDFFDLGGHSLLATQLVSRLRAALGVEIPLRAVFEAPTVRGLAARIDGARGHAVPPPIAGAPDAERRRLSYAQRRLWFLDRLEPGAAYNLPFSILLRGALDVEALERALTEVVGRHEAFRTRIVEGPEGPEQIVDPPEPIRLLVEDLVSLSRPARSGTEHARTKWVASDGTALRTDAEEGVGDVFAAAGLEAARRESDRRTQDEILRPFDLARGPLARFVLRRLAPDEHILLATVHHIAADGWSLVIFERELRTLYGSFARGERSPLEPMAFQYADWAAWQRDWLESSIDGGESEMDRQLAWWRAELEGAVPLALHPDRPRPARPTRAGASLQFLLGPALRDRLARIAREEGATLHMALLAGYAEALGRWSGQREIVVGTPVANRRIAEAEPMVGFFVNTLANRIRLRETPGPSPHRRTGDVTFRDLLRSVRETTLGAYAHQDVPFERLIEALRPGRDTGHTPYIRTLFALQSPPSGEIAIPGLSFVNEEPETGICRFDLELFFMECESGLDGALNFSTEIFDRGTVEAFAANLAALLQSVVNEPDRPLARIEGLAEAERRRLLAEWNAPREVWPDPPVVHALFERHAALAPEAVAARFGEESITYGELNARANRLARVLRRQGVGVESLVAVCLDRSVDMLVALLGTMKAGAAYVPIDPEYPEGRIALLVEDAGAAFVLTQARLASRLSASGARVIQLGADGGEIAREEPGDLDVAIPADALVYVGYTSGSTGRPKGVAMTHRAIANLLSWQRRDSDPGRPTGSWTRRAPTTLQFASLSFDVSFQEIFSTLTAGGEIVLVTEEERRDPAGLIRIIADQKVGRLFLPFVALDQIAETAAVEDLALPELREIDTAGEQLRITPAIAGLFARLPGCRLVNHYGPSETHLVTTFELGGDPALWPALPPIGCPIPNAPVYVLDDEGRPSPLGAVGEIFVGGAGLARGYHGRPDLTAERFVPDPFSGDPGARLYRTGDLARRRSNGTLEFLGRRDDQLKVRGYRVEPGEIEAALARHPAVRQAVVAAREHRGGKRLAAWVVLDETSTAAPQPSGAGERADTGSEKHRGGNIRPLDAAELRRTLGDIRDHLARTLPEFMIPAAIVPLTDLPLSPNGKVDRAALPEPEWGGSEAFVPPRTPEEEIVCGIVADVLALERVGATDDFFDLGGHSLLATQVVSRLRRALGCEVPLRALFEDPTPAGVAEAAVSARAASARDGVGAIPPPLTRTASGERRALSFAQSRLWFLDRMEPGAAAYNLPVAVRLEGDLDTAALRRAVAEIVQRHEALRTRFIDGPDGPVAIADAPFDASLEPEPVDVAPVIEGEHPGVPVHLASDVAGSGPPGASDADRSAGVMAAVHRMLDEEARRPFDLAHGPLLRARLLQIGPRDHVLSLVVHHIAADGWSLGVLVRELGALYAAYASGQNRSPLPPLPVQYADWAAWQRAWLAGGELDRQLAWWRQALDGAPASLDLPPDRARPAVASGRGATLEWRPSPGLAERIGRIARREGATLHMALLAGYAATLMRQGGLDEVVVGTPVANRRAAEAEGLVGFFVNTLAVRVRGGRERVRGEGAPGDRDRGERGRLTFRELLARVRDASLGAYAHQDVPFERVVEELRPERSLNRAPIFQTAFALQNARIPRIDLPGLCATSIEAETGTAKFDLMLVAEETEGGGLEGTFEYSTDLFDGETIESIARRLERTLEGAAADPDAPLDAIPWMEEEESRRIREEWSRGRDPVETIDATGPPMLLHALVERQAARTPGAPALAMGDETITYRAMDERANRLAHHLRGLGAGPDCRVVVLLERSPEAIVAALAVMKAGAAWVPLDTAQPDRRIADLIEECGATIVVTVARFATKDGAEDLDTRPSRARIVILDADADRAALAACPAVGPETTARPANLAYVIFTSGSTGRPKAVGVEHRQIAGYVEAAIERLGIEPGWRFLLVSTLAADLGHTAIFPALATGGCLDVLPAEIALDAPRFEDLVAERAIDAIKIVPSHMQALLSGARPERAMPRRLLVLGGEGIPGARLDTLLALASAPNARRSTWTPDSFRSTESPPSPMLSAASGIEPECRVAIHYGPTEATVGAVADAPEPSDAARTLAPLGRPLANARAYVLDARGRLAAPGVPGELVLGGEGVARGYLGRPDLTAERFVPDPFSDRPGARAYRTGDRARWLADGRLEFLGRADAQVKVRGFRVELGEIESAIASLPGVREAAVVAREDGSGGKRLVVAVVPEPRFAPTIGGLARRRLASGLAVAELNRNETDYIEREIFELRAYLRHGIALRDGDTVFDVGANIGLFTVFASLACAAPRIVAFEPNPHLQPILRANAAAYAPGATILDVGLGGGAGEAAFTFFPGFSLLSGLHADAGVEKAVVRAFLENQARLGSEGAAALAREADALLDERFVGQTLTVPLRTLSEVLAELGIDRIHLLKVNVEKSELDVLRGIRDEDWARIDQAVVEVDVAASLPEIVALFETHGFDVHVEQDPLLTGTDLGYVYAVRRGSERALVPGASPSVAVSTMAGALPSAGSSSPVIVRIPDEPLLTSEALRAQLARILPDPMVPAAWVFVDALPLTANGKLDRSRIPDPPAPAGAADFIAPRGTRERAIASIWAEALGRPHVGVHDNFFDLGGHSLLLAQVHARLTNELGADLSVVDLFRYPTVAALAERLAARAPEAGAAEADRARGVDRRSAARARARAHRPAEESGQS